MTRLRDLKRFYSLLDDLERVCGGKRTLQNSDGRMGWPDRGCYFFFEPGEERKDSGAGPRVTRVGTHAVSSGSRTTLWKRLSQHRGVQKSGGGNHRSSIFRLLIGEAISRKDPKLKIETWGKGNSAPPKIGERETSLELTVSAYIRKMPFLWLSVDDAPSRDSARGYIERNAISLLSNYCAPHMKEIDPPSQAWLGKFSLREPVHKSGLWNQRHVKDDYEQTFLDVLENAIRQQ